MKTKPVVLKLLTYATAILLSAIVIGGCTAKKPADAVAHKPKETEEPRKAESAATKDASEKQDSSKVAQETAHETYSETQKNEFPPASGDRTGPKSPDSDSSALDEMTEGEYKAAISETWSSQRIVALSAKGPIVFDVLVNVGGKSLDEAAAAATDRAIARIEKDLEKPWTWPKFLEHPLIRSGWLGNLVADAEQREALIAKYNSDGDEEVEDDELRAFLTRGLSGRAAFQFSDVGSVPSHSPWEQLDANSDSSLDQKEIANIPQVVAALDLNADHSVTMSEIQSSRSTMASQPTMANKMASAFQLPAEKLTQGVIERRLLENYNAFKSPIGRDQWPSWSDEHWNYYDKDNDGQLTSSELLAIATVQPDFALKIKFKSLNEAGCEISVALNIESGFEWSSRLSTSGQMAGKRGAVAAVVKDSYTAANRSALRDYLTLAIANPQVASTLQTTLNLQEGALDILDADNDDKLSDEEFENAWDWLSAIRGNRILTRWTFADSAWFRFADTDADGRATEMEIQKLASKLTQFDEDKDGIVSPPEVPHIGFQIPFAMQLEITRTDDRLNANIPNPVDQPSAERGWFAASDSNNDGSISKSEFLGSTEDFLAYDADNDGFITATEAYKNPSTRVQ